MKSNLLVIVIFLSSSCSLWDQGLALCQTGHECFGTRIPGLNNFDECCGPVFNDYTLSRSFLSGASCSPCYVVGLDQARYSLTETFRQYSLRLRILAPAGQTGALFERPRLRLLGIPGMASERDYSYVTSDILLTTFSGMNISFTIPLDNIAGEPNETFIVTYQSPLVSSPNDAKFLFRNTTITIVDGEKPTYEFLMTDHSQFEGMVSECNRVTILQTGPRVVTSIVLLVTPMTYAQYIARSAIDPTLSPIDTYHGSRPTPATYNPSGKKDFNNTVLRIAFPPDSEEGSFLSVPIDVLDDSIDEYPEGFILLLDVDTNLNVADVAFTPSKRTILVKIYDNDLFYFGFEQQEYIYNEESDEGIQEIPFSAAPGYETEKSFYFSIEFTPLQGNFLFGPSGDLSFGSSIIQFATIQFSDGYTTPFVLNDNIIEGTEIGEISIIPSTAFRGHGSRHQTVRIVITDDEAVTLSLAAPSTVSESIGTFFANISLLQLTGLSIEFEVDIHDTGITATRNADFRRRAPPSVVFDSSTCCNQSVPYLVRDDNIAEPDEILSIKIERSIVSANIPVVYHTQSVDVKIVDNDVARIGFTRTSITAAEGTSATLTIAVLGNIGLGRNVIVRLSTVDISTTSGIDYASKDINLTFNSTAPSHAVPIGILRDGASERAEQFRAILHIVDVCIKVNLSPSIATVTIPSH